MITGVVTDPSLSPIPNTEMRVINEQSGSATELTTNESGLYRANSLLPGLYTVEAKANGFALSSRNARSAINRSVARVRFRPAAWIGDPNGQCGGSRRS